MAPIGEYATTNETKSTRELDGYRGEGEINALFWGVFFPCAP